MRASRVFAADIGNLVMSNISLSSWFVAELDPTGSEPELQINVSACWGNQTWTVHITKDWRGVGFVFLCYTDSGRSFKNKRGPSTLPCVTPETTENWLFPIHTLKSLRKTKPQVPRNPNSLSWYNNSLWQILSEAFAKSHSKDWPAVLVSVAKCLDDQVTGIKSMCYWISNFVCRCCCSWEQ